MLFTYVGIPGLSDSVTAWGTFLVANSYWSILSYASLTVTAAISPPANKPLYRFAHLGSFYAWLCFTLSFGRVIVGMIQSGQQIHQLADVPGAIELLVALWVFSCADFFWFQRHKHKELFGLAGQNTVTNPQGIPLQTLQAPRVNFLQQVAVALRMPGVVRIGPVQVSFELDPTSGTILLDAPDLATLNLVPAAAPAPSAP